jgi:hypothetical protein
MIENRRRLAVMQPYFLPHLSYFQLIAAVDKLVIYDDVNFMTGGWINRNRILVNGAPYTFTVPLQAVSQNKAICDIRLAEDSNWRDKTLRTVALNYKKAPEYSSVMPMLERIFQYKSKKLDELIYNSLREITQYIGLRTIIQNTSRIYGNRHLRAQARILDICIIENAQTYVNTPGGRKLYNKENFNENGIELLFLETKAVVYEQRQAGFVDSLSVIDVLMFNDLPRIQKMMDEYELL